MSAYMTTKTHISVLAAYYAETERSPSEFERVYEETFEMFNQANAKSLLARYGDEMESNLHGKAPNYFNASRRARLMEPIQLIKLANCFEYQSCEDWKFWEGSTARKRIASIISEALPKVPGYQEAEWSLADPAEPEEDGPVSLSSLLGL